MNSFIRQDGAFDKAVQDVDGVIHTASPVVLTAVDPEGEIISRGAFLYLFGVNVRI